MPAHRRPQAAAAAAPPNVTAIDLDHYVPGYLTWVSNKLSRGASQAYLRVFGVGIETWRLMVLLAIEGELTANEASRIIGMDKASVSRCFKSMQSKGQIEMRLDAKDGRLRVASFTAQGRAVHDQIIGLALERERAFLSALAPEEARQFLSLLVRLHENLPAVEAATAAYIDTHFPDSVAEE
jgi:DNA-binding MarR family transcriptional regulator